MQIELSEILTCPECRSPQGLVVLVDELDGEGRVRSGRLGCSRCERRYPVRGRVVDLLDGPEAEPPPPRDADAPATEELTAEIGGLLDLGSVSGPVVLGHGLARVAGPLAGLVGGVSILALAGESAPTPGDGSTGSTDATGPFTLVLAPAGRLPLLPGKAGGVALWKPGAGALEDACRALAPGARLAILRPDGEARRELDSSDLEILASEERAAVARRSG